MFPSCIGRRPLTPFKQTKASVNKFVWKCSIWNYLKIELKDRPLERTFALIFWISFGDASATIHLPIIARIEISSQAHVEEPSFSGTSTSSSTGSTLSTLYCCCYHCVIVTALKFRALQRSWRQCSAVFCSIIFTIDCDTSKNMGAKWTYYDT